MTKPSCEETRQTTANPYAQFMKSHLVVVARVVVRAGLRIAGFGLVALGVAATVAFIMTIPVQARMANAGTTPAFFGVSGIIPGLMYVVLASPCSPPIGFS